MVAQWLNPSFKRHARDMSSYITFTYINLKSIY